MNALSRGSIFLTLVLSTGCNLIFDLEEYPYSVDSSDMLGPDLVEDMDVLPDLEPTDMTDMNVPDMPDMPDDVSVDLPDDGPDLPVEVPRLMISEIMINTSPSGGNGELGEYIEVKNIGSSPADPRQISFILHNLPRSGSISVPPPVTAEQLAVFNGLNVIQPGDYFVFIRYVVPELPIESLVGEGNYFDFGTYGNAASIGNSGDRSAELQYFDGSGFVVMDSVRWAANALRPSDQELDTPSLPMTEDVSFGVRAGFEDPELNDSPDNWCLETTPASGPDSFIGSPGGPARCD